MDKKEFKMSSQAFGTFRESYILQYFKNEFSKFIVYFSKIILAINKRNLSLCADD